MGKTQATRREQREFLFVIDSKPGKTHKEIDIEVNEGASCVRNTDLDSEEAKVARNKLIAELREFGC